MASEERRLLPGDEENRGYGYDNAPTVDYVSTEHAGPKSGKFIERVKVAKLESQGSQANFCCALCSLLFGSVGCAVILGLFLLVPISMIVMGSYFLYDCPKQRYIPIYLVVAGCFGVFLNICRLAYSSMKSRDREPKKNPFELLVSFFLFAWFIAGNVWIYGSYGSVEYDDVTSKDYCNRYLYLYAFWMTNVTYIIIGLSCFVGCCTACCAVCCCRRAFDDI